MGRFTQVGMLRCKLCGQYVNFYGKDYHRRECRGPRSAAALALKRIREENA